MLSIMRKQARSWMIKILLFAISIVFIFWGFSGINAPREDNFVAKVNGESITYSEYRESYGQLRERYRRAYGDINDEIMKSLNLDRQVLDQLVNRTLMLQEAERLNIQVADQMIDQAIMKFPAFQNNGEFDEERAKMVLAQNRISTADLRDSFRKDMIIGQLHSMITEGVVASEAEAKEWYSWYNAEIDLNFVLFQPETIKDVSATEEQITEFFKLNENNYRTEPQVKVRYIFLDPADYKEQVEIGQEQIAEYYHRHPEEFRFEKTIEARHILLQLDENADPQTVDNKKQEAMKIYKMALDGRSFPELAKKYSEGPTRDEGGYLGEFKREAMVKPFGDKAFSMQAGEISEPVRTRFGWHIIKVEKVNDARTLSLEEAARTIREKLVAEMARASALKQAEEIYDSALFVGVNLADLAQSRGLAVKTTGFFDLQGPAASDIEDRQSFAQAAFGLDGTTVSDVLDLGDGYYLLQLVDRTESSVPPLASVKDRVEQDLVASIRVERAKSDAEAFLAELRKGQSMAEAGKVLGVQHEQTGFFKRTDSIPKIGYEQAIVQAAFELGSENKLPDQVFQGQQGWYVIELSERLLPPVEGFEKERDGIVKRVTDQKKQSTIQQWLADLKERGQVQINYNLIQ
jgi:peptidyl-prolyl cis-trans isomerase D